MGLCPCESQRMLQTKILEWALGVEAGEAAQVFAGAWGRGGMEATSSFAFWPILSCVLVLPSLDGKRYPRTNGLASENYSEDLKRACAEGRSWRDQPGLLPVS